MADDENVDNSEAAEESSSSSSDSVWDSPEDKVCLQANLEVETQQTKLTESIVEKPKRNFCRFLILNPEERNRQKRTLQRLRSQRIQDAIEEAMMPTRQQLEYSRLENGTVTNHSPNESVEKRENAENLRVRKMLKEKQAEVKKKRLKAKTEAYKAKKIAFLKEIMKQEKILQREEYMENTIERKRREQVELKAEIGNDTQEYNILLEKLQSECQTIKEVDREIEEFVQRDTEKRAKRQQEIKDRQQATNTTKKEQLNIEKEKHAVEIKKLELMMKKSDNAAIILILKDKKPKLMNELLKDKYQLELKQQLFGEKEDQLKSLKIKFEAKQLLVEELKDEHGNASLGLEDARKKLMQVPIEFEQLCNDVISKRKEKLDSQFKKIENIRVDIDLVKADLDEKSKELESLKKELKDEEEAIKVAEMKFKRNKQILREFEDEDKSLDHQLESVDYQIKSQDSSLNFLVEPEDKDAISGQKSPGIPQSPFQNKRVTLNGIPAESAEHNKRKSSIPNLEEMVDIHKKKKTN